MPEPVFGAAEGTMGGKKQVDFSRPLGTWCLFGKNTLHYELLCAGHMCAEFAGGRVSSLQVGSTKGCLDVKGLEEVKT